MFGLNGLSGLAAAVFVAGATLFSSVPLERAEASVYLEFDRHLTGEDLGNVTVANATFEDDAGGVKVSFYNTLFSFPDSFDFRLFLKATVPPTPTSITNLDGKTASLANASNVGGIDWNIGIGWPSANNQGGIHRLKPGDFSIFRLEGIALSQLFPNSPPDLAAVVHVNNTLNGDSTHYAAVVPLPAAAWLILAGLGGLGLMSRRKAAAA